MKENKALKIFIAVVIISFVVHQLYSSFYNPVTTQNAQYCTAIDGITVDATIIRQEQIVESTASGTLHFRASDGSRVAKGGIVADIYDSANASITVSRIEELSSQIADIEEIQNYNDVAAADLEMVNGKVSGALNGYIRNASTGDFENSYEDSCELLSAINRKQCITGETVDFTARLNALNGELASLNASLPTARGSIRAEKAGYFISAVDGYEQALSCDKIDKITPEYLENLKSEKISENAIGKIVSDYDWYIACPVSLNDSLRYKEGDELTVKTPIKNTPSLSVTVKQINVSENKDSAVLILSCQQMNGELATMRTGIMTVVSKEYEGLKVPSKALRVKKGKTGVYIVSGITVKFVGVNVIYTGDDYILCEQIKENRSDILRLYDSVIVKGKNLYDGKTIG